MKANGTVSKNGKVVLVWAITLITGAIMLGALAQVAKAAPMLESQARVDSHILSEAWQIDPSLFSAMADSEGSDETAIVPEVRAPSAVSDLIPQINPQLIPELIPDAVDDGADEPGDDTPDDGGSDEPGDDTPGDDTPDDGADEPGDDTPDDGGSDDSTETPEIVLGDETETVPSSTETPAKKVTPKPTALTTLPFTGGSGLAFMVAGLLAMAASVALIVKSRRQGMDDREEMV